MTGPLPSSTPLRSTRVRLDDLRDAVEGFPNLPDPQSEAALQRILSLARDVVSQPPSQRSEVEAVLRPLDLAADELREALDITEGAAGTGRATRPLTVAEREALSSAGVPFLVFSVGLVLAAGALAVVLVYLYETASAAWALAFGSGNAAQVACNASLTCLAIGWLLVSDILLLVFSPLAIFGFFMRGTARRVLRAGTVEVLSGPFEKRRLVGRGVNYHLVFEGEDYTLQSMGRADVNRWVYDRVPDVGPARVEMAMARRKGGSRGLGWIVAVEGAAPSKPVLVGVRPDPRRADD